VDCWLDHMQTTCNAANDLGPCEKAAAACLYGVMTCPLNPAATVIVDKPWDGIERRPDGKTVKSGRWGDEYTYKCSNTARGPQWMPSSFGEVCAAAIEVPVNAGESACRGIWNVVKWPFSGPPPRCSKYR